MFSVTEMRTFELFSVPHIAVLLMFVAVSFFMVYYRVKLKPHQPIIKWILLCILVVSEISGHIWLVATDQWGYDSLPLHLCSVSTFIAVYLFFKPSKKAFNFLFFTGLIPPILSIITPEVFYQFPHYRFLKYFLHHSAITWTVLFFIIYQGYRVPRKAIWTGFVTLNLISIPIFFINLFLNTNYFYLASPTESETILTYFGSGLMYYITLEIAALVVLFISYLPMGWLLKRESGSGRQ